MNIRYYPLFYIVLIFSCADTSVNPRNYYCHELILEIKEPVYSLSDSTVKIPFTIFNTSAFTRHIEYCDYKLSIFQGASPPCKEFINTVFNISLPGYSYYSDTCEVSEIGSYKIMVMVDRNKDGLRDCFCTSDEIIVEYSH